MRRRQPALEVRIRSAVLRVVARASKFAYVVQPEDIVARVRKTYESSGFPTTYEGRVRGVERALAHYSGRGLIHYRRSLGWRKTVRG